MTTLSGNPFLTHLDSIKDPRHHNTQHLLYDILLITLCAVISGADAWTQVAEYGRSKSDWFKEFLKLPNGIPSHDTFGRLFTMLDPNCFQEFFSKWVQDLPKSLKGQTVSIDGKSLRRSHDHASNKSPIHMVSAWASDIGMVLGQLKTDEKSNEITAIPELIKTLALDGAIVTIDAMGCQKKITQTIIEQGAQYVIQVKDNQKSLHQDITLFFKDPKNGPFDTYETVDGDHGRIETRTYFTSSNIDWLQGKHLWAGINTIVMVGRKREINGAVSTEDSFFISSLENKPNTIANAIRKHWHIENQLHWCLDIAFSEDLCRVRKKHAPQNFAVIRHMAMNLLKRESSLKGGIKTKRLKSAWDHQYLLKVINS